MNTLINTTKSIASIQAETQIEALTEKNAKKKNNPTFVVRIELHLEYDDDQNEIEDAFIKNSGILIIHDYGYFKIARITKAQYDYLKSNNIQIYGKWDWIPHKKKLHDKNKIYIRDIYYDYWKEEKKEDTHLFFLSRNYKDLNSDGIPEVLIPYYGGSGGSDYKVFQITKEGYLSLGSISYILIQTLPSQHNGMNDLMYYWHLSASDGYLHVAEYNGFSYESVKEMPVILDQAIQEKIFVPDKESENEEHPHSDYLQWSSKDDDKYRKMIK